MLVCLPNILAKGKEKTSKRTTSFQPKNFIEFVLKPVEKHPTTGEIKSVACKFCINSSHKEKIGAKHKPTSNTKYFCGSYKQSVTIPIMCMPILANEQSIKISHTNRRRNSAPAMMLSMVSSKLFYIISLYVL